MALPEDRRDDLELFLGAAAGDGAQLPDPQTRVERYLAHIADPTVDKPDHPETRTELFLDAIEGGGGYEPGDIINVTTITADSSKTIKNVIDDGGIKIKYNKSIIIGISFGTGQSNTGVTNFFVASNFGSHIESSAFVVSRTGNRAHTWGQSIAAATDKVNFASGAVSIDGDGILNCSTNPDAKPFCVSGDRIMFIEIPFDYSTGEIDISPFEQILLMSKIRDNKDDIEIHEFYETVTVEKGEIE